MTPNNIKGTIEHINNIVDCAETAKFWINRIINNPANNNNSALIESSIVMSNYAKRIINLGSDIIADIDMGVSKDVVISSISELAQISSHFISRKYFKNNLKYRVNPIIFDAIDTILFSYIDGMDVKTDYYKLT